MAATALITPAKGPEAPRFRMITHAISAKAIARAVGAARNINQNCRDGSMGLAVEFE